MNKAELVSAYNDYETRLLLLRGKDEAQARTPYAEGKWSAAQIIMHLAEWDRFTIEKRFPYMEAGAELAPFPEFQAFNEKAAAKADALTFAEIVDEAIRQREVLRKKLEDMQPEWWEIHFSIGGRPMTPAHYFGRFVKHDHHHFKQIDAVFS